jgi:myo-inositol-1(or 4)-monophosphatase
MLPANAALLVVAEEAARAGAQVLLSAFGGAQTARQKSHLRDLVTAADTASEHAILAILATVSGEIGLLSEEAGLTRPGARALWIVDPLDGTANFARGYPIFSISIACVAPDGPLCGLILDPLRDELYMATRGGGARLGDRQLHVSEASELGGAFVSTGFPYFPSEDRRRMADVIAVLATEAQDVRRGGSAALDLASVAAGRSEAHIELNLAPHDVAAGVLLVMEAGGRVEALRKDANGWPRGLIASNGSLLHDAVRDPVAAAFALQAAPLSFNSLFA